MNTTPEMLTIIGSIMDERHKFQVAIERKIIAKFPEIETAWLQTLVRMYISYN